MKSTPRSPTPRRSVQTEIDVGGRDEIGVLAQAFDGMRNSIRSLVAELKQTNKELEDANRTLEERVDERTNEVVAAQQKLVDAIESTSEGFAFTMPTTCLCCTTCSMNSSFTAAPT